MKIFRFIEDKIVKTTSIITRLYYKGAVKVWDVRIGRVLKELTDHTSSVTCVKFHPHEFLLASCAADKVLNFWDMEKFQLISSIDRQAYPIR